MVQGENNLGTFMTPNFTHTLNILTLLIYIFWHFQATFDSPQGNDPLALDMNTMGKGEIWINGNSIGRHWPGNKAFGTCQQCSYAGFFYENKCLYGCGQPSQRW